MEKYAIRMGIPEMKQLWDELYAKNQSGTLNNREKILYKKWGTALAHLSADPTYPGLKSHEIDILSKRYGIRVWQSYLENRKSAAMRMYWIYGPGKNEITIIGLEPHPEDKKNGGYDKVILSSI